VTLLAADLAHVQVQDWLRREIWNLLRQAGLVSELEPSPIPRSSALKPALRVVRPEKPPE
jgi:hypothetical protein